MATTVDIKQLLEAGAYFGHKTSRWHPKMAPYIHSKRDGTHIIDLTKTVEAMESALAFLAKTAGEGKQILFVGTKRQAQQPIRELADALGQPFVTERWLGGMLTNQTTMSARIKHLKDLETRMASGALETRYNKLEVQRFQEEIDELNRLYGGIKHMAARPGAVVTIDVVNDQNAIREANRLNIPVVSLVDTNVDPSQIAYPIPANDDALKTIALYCDYIKQAVSGAQAKAKKPAEKADKDEKPTAKKEG